ncbi:hypothetical protein D3C77_568700 [compost metagenome]
MPDDVLEQIVQYPAEALGIDRPFQRLIRQLDIDDQPGILPDWIPGGSALSDDTIYILRLDRQGVPAAGQQIVGQQMID